MSTTAIEGTEAKLYAIFRNGFRVSESEYDSKDRAYAEYDYWTGILKRWPDGSKLDIRELNYRRRD